jgi:hypothetical protein
MYGRKYMGVERTTFVIGPNGVIREVFRRVKPAAHDELVLGRAGSLGGAQAVRAMRGRRLVERGANVRWNALIERSAHAQRAAQGDCGRGVIILTLRTPPGIVARQV